MSALKNWQQYKSPRDPLSTFTRSEPFPSQEVKATYTGDNTKKQGAKTLFAALLNRRKKQMEAR